MEEENLEPQYVSKTEYFVQMRIPKEVLGPSEDEEEEEVDVYFKTVAKEEAPSIDFEFSVTLHKLPLCQELRDFLLKPLEMKVMKKVAEVLVEEEEEPVKKKKSSSKKRPTSSRKGKKSRASDEQVQEESEQETPSSPAPPPPPKERNTRVEYVGSGYFEMLGMFDFMTVRIEQELEVRNILKREEEPSPLKISVSASLPDNPWVDFIRCQQSKQENDARPE